jgi:hypothetical protein
MLQWLAQCTARPYEWPDGKAHNERIPAGYTYLAQLVAHDVVQTATPIPMENDQRLWRRNLRTNRLMLDTLYGGGPDTHPLAYAIESHRGADGRHEWMDRVRLRLSRVRPVSRPGRPDVLIPDLRNDDNLIVSQLTVVFHLLHNTVYEALENQNGPLPFSRQKETPVRRRLFRDARRVVTLVYREIVFSDLLSRLLHPAVQATYSQKDIGDFYDHGDDRLPLEFSHAAYRVGRAMVRDDYHLNQSRAGENSQRVSLADVLLTTSSGIPKRMPLTKPVARELGLPLRRGAGWSRRRHRLQLSARPFACRSPRQRGAVRISGVRRRAPARQRPGALGSDTRCGIRSPVGFVVTCRPTARTIECTHDVFGDAWPRTMPERLHYVAAQKGWGGPDHEFVVPRQPQGDRINVPPFDEAGESSARSTR